MILATRYAKSLLDLANEQACLEVVYKDMLMIRDICRESRDFVLLIESPIIKADKKIGILATLFKDKVNNFTFSFLQLITQKGREMYIDNIAEAFVEQYKQHKKILTAVVTSSIGLDEVVRKKVYDLVKASTTGEVELVEKVDADLIGGFVLRIGDKQVDASIARKLNDLRKNFSENPYIKEF